MAKFKAMRALMSRAEQVKGQFDDSETPFKITLADGRLFDTISFTTKEPEKGSWKELANMSSLIMALKQIVDQYRNDFSYFAPEAPSSQKHKRSSRAEKYSKQLQEALDVSIDLDHIDSTPGEVISIQKDVQRLARVQLALKNILKNVPARGMNFSPSFLRAMAAAFYKVLGPLDPAAIERGEMAQLASVAIQALSSSREKVRTLEAEKKGFEAIRKGLDGTIIKQAIEIESLKENEEKIRGKLQTAESQLAAAKSDAEQLVAAKLAEAATKHARVVREYQDSEDAHKQAAEMQKDLLKSQQQENERLKGELAAKQKMLDEIGRRTQALSALPETRQKSEIDAVVKENVELREKVTRLQQGFYYYFLLILKLLQGYNYTDAQKYCYEQAKTYCGAALKALNESLEQDQTSNSAQIREDAKKKVEAEMKKITEAAEEKAKAAPALLSRAHTVADFSTPKHGSSLLNLFRRKGDSQSPSTPPQSSSAATPKSTPGSSPAVAPARSLNGRAANGVGKQHRRTSTIADIAPPSKSVNAAVSMIVRADPVAGSSAPPVTPQSAAVSTNFGASPSAKRK